MRIELDKSKLLGFRLAGDVSISAKIGSKVGFKTEPQKK